MTLIAAAWGGVDKNMLAFSARGPMLEVDIYIGYFTKEICVGGNI